MTSVQHGTITKAVMNSRMASARSLPTMIIEQSIDYTFSNSVNVQGILVSGSMIVDNTD